jgi:predicted transcriptional regulator
VIKASAPHPHDAFDLPSTRQCSLLTALTSSTKIELGQNQQGWFNRADSAKGRRLMDAVSGPERDLLLSVRPIYASKIFDGQKTVELRRKFPHKKAAGAIALIYSSSPVSAVVGFARIKRVLKLPVGKLWKEYGSAACISKSDFDAYFAGVKFGFAVLLGSVQSLKMQIKAVDLKSQFGIVPPQSYRYVTNDCLSLMRDERFQAADRYKYRHRAGRPSARAGITRRVGPA